MTTVNIVSMLTGLREAGCRITTICKCKGYVINLAISSLCNKVMSMVLSFKPALEFLKTNFVGKFQLPNYVLEIKNAPFYIP